MQTKNYSFHIIAALCLSVLGAAPITALFYNATPYSFLSFALAAAVAISVALIFSFCFPRDFSACHKGINKIFLMVFVVSGFLLCLLSALITLKDFWRLSAKVLLPRAPEFISLALILALLIYFGFAKREAFLKFCLIMLLPVSVTVVLLFCLSMPSMKLMNISVYSLPPVNKLSSHSLSYLLNIFVTATPSLILAHAVLPQIKKRTLLSGLLSGSLLLGIILLQALLVLGSGINYFEFPYLSAVGTLTFGNLFTRLDGFVYFMFLICAAAKITVCINAAKYLLSLIKNKNSP
ncbi:MAG: hypothetical protein IJZ75_06900 [Clostridia bacterium]|nr:hypothetical protein [Clostridia bacterium]